MPERTKYQPTAFYYREALRAAKTRAAALEVGLELVLELERHKAWIRDQGLIPPKWLITPNERAAKAWAEVSPFPSTAPESGTEG
jgi:hypothetical protein